MFDGLFDVFNKRTLREAIEEYSAFVASLKGKEKKHCKELISTLSYNEAESCGDPDLFEDWGSALNDARYTRSFHALFETNEDMLLVGYEMLSITLKHANENGGNGYLQIFSYKGEDLWVHYTPPEKIVFLLPKDY